MSNTKTALSLMTGTLILSIIGFYNGYPLVYSDTGTYIYSGFDTFIPVDRPITYGLLIKFVSIGWSTWFVVFFQNFLTAFVLFEVLKIFDIKSSRFNQIYYSVLLFLVLFTGIGWYSNQLMPDFFAPLTILVIFVLLKEVNTHVFSKVALCLILIYSLISHFSHLLIGTSLVVIITFVKFIFKKRITWLSFKRLSIVASIIFSAWIILPVINYFTEKQFILSKGSHVFLMAHLNDTGILKKFLIENCSTSEYSDCKLCDYKDSLPPDLASFIWSGHILENTGGWIESQEEYNKIIFGTLKEPKYLFLNIYRSTIYGLIQLTKNEIGQGLSAYTEGSPPYGLIEWRFYNELNNYLNSRQNKWQGSGLDLSILNTIHHSLILLFLFFVIILFTSSLHLKISSATLTFLKFVVVAIMVNSFITAGLNSPCERFQARVVWLFPLAVILILVKNYKNILNYYLLMRKKE